MPNNKKYKLRLWDIESGYNVANIFSLFNKYINYTAITQERYIICGTVKDVGDPKSTRSFSLLDNLKAFKKDPTNDYHVVKALSDYLQDSDGLVAHNGDNFDIKFLNTRMLFHGLKPLPPVVQIDTLKIAKNKFRFNSNRLDYIAQYLGVGAKKKIGEQVWVRALNGDANAVKEMLEYNVVDVAVLEAVYTRLAPYARTQLNPNLFSEGLVCSNPACGSSRLVRNKQGRLTLTRVYDQYVCKDCGKYTSVTTALRTTTAK